MELNIQLFTGGCRKPTDLDVAQVMEKLRRILKRTRISNGLIGWNINTDVTEIIKLLKDAGAGVYLWLPVFSELDGLADFSPIVSACGGALVNYDRGNGETFNFCCPARPDNVDKVIGIFEKYYDNGSYDGVFIDKVRFPSFAGGKDAVYSCYCDYCRSRYDLPDPLELDDGDSQKKNENINPLGLTGYTDMRYSADGAHKKLFDYKGAAVFNSLNRLCAYFRGRGLKIGMDLFAPFLSYFVGQDYRRLAPLADFIKPMFYNMTNAPAGLPFEISAYAAAFGGCADMIEARRKFLIGAAGYGDPGFIAREVSGICEIIKTSRLNTKLYAGVEINYSDISPVTRAYIEQSVRNVGKADGIVASWDLNTTPVSHIDYLLNSLAP